MFNISHYFLLIRSLGAIHKGLTQHTSQLPTTTKVWVGASGAQDEGSKKEPATRSGEKTSGEGTWVKD